MLLEDRVCLVTGASGGIGRALACALARDGANLILTGRDEARLAETAEAVGAARCLACYSGDLRAPATLNGLAELAAQHEVSALFNVSGANQLKLFDGASDEDIESLIGINLVAPMQLTRRLLPLLRAHPQAAIVNVGSAFGAIGHAGYVNYCASKFGLRGFSEALSRELADCAIQVVHVAPRATRTAMNGAAAARLNQVLGNAEDPPDVVAQAVLAAVRGNRKRSAVGWPERFFIHLNQILPGVVDRALGGKLTVVKQTLQSAGAQK